LFMTIHYFSSDEVSNHYHLTQLLWNGAMNRHIVQFWVNYQCEGLVKALSRETCIAIGEASQIILSATFEFNVSYTRNNDTKCHLD
jgi:hypothetical protein